MAPFLEVIKALEDLTLDIVDDANLLFEDKKLLEDQDINKCDRAYLDSLKEEFAETKRDVILKAKHVFDICGIPFFVKKKDMDFLRAAWGAYYECFGAVAEDCDLSEKEQGDILQDICQHLAGMVYHLERI